MRDGNGWPTSGSIAREAAATPSSLHARGDAETVEQVDEIFGGEVAGGARRVRTSAQAAGRRIEDRNACLEAGIDIDERRAARVVKVQGQLR